MMDAEILNQFSERDHRTVSSRAAGPRMPGQGWTLPAQTHCQTKDRLMPCSGILEWNAGTSVNLHVLFSNWKDHKGRDKACLVSATKCEREQRTTKIKAVTSLEPTTKGLGRGNQISGNFL